MGCVKEEREGDLHKYCQMKLFFKILSPQFLVDFKSNKEAFSIPGYFTCRQFSVSTTKHQNAGDRSSPAFVLSVALNTLSYLFNPDHSAVPVAHKMLLHVCCSSVCLYTQLWFRNGVHTKTLQNHALLLCSRMERTGGTKGKHHGLR